MHTSEAWEAGVWTPLQKPSGHRPRPPGDKPGPRVLELHWWPHFAEDPLRVGLGAEESTASPQAFPRRFHFNPHSTADTAERLRPEAAEPMAESRAEPRSH